MVTMTHWAVRSHIARFLRTVRSGPLDSGVCVASRRGKCHIEGRRRHRQSWRRRAHHLCDRWQQVQPTPTTRPARPRRTRLTDPAQLWPDWRYHALATNIEMLRPHPPPEDPKWSGHQPTSPFTKGQLVDQVRADQPSCQTPPCPRVRRHGYCALTGADPRPVGSDRH